MKIGNRTRVFIACTGRTKLTAACETARVLGLSSSDDLEIAGCFDDAELVVALIGCLDVVGDIIESGMTDIHNISGNMDAYEILVFDGKIVLLGNTPRGVLQAVYKLHEIVLETGGVPDHISERGVFRIGMRLFHPRFDYWPGTRDDIRYISHIGATHCLHTHDWQNDRRRFAGYVDSSVFPDSVDPGFRREGHRELRRLIDDCLDYGLEVAMWITELPCQGGAWVPEEERRRFLDRYPAEVLSDSGTNQGSVLCFGHPDVRRFYRELVEGFFTDFPEISILFVMGLDANGEFCDPDSCPRCRGMSKIEQRDRFMEFLIEHGTRVRPGLRVLTTGWGWRKKFPREFFDRQKSLPRESGLFMAAQIDGWQAERQNNTDLLESRDICRAREQLFVGYDNFHWGDDTIHRLNDIQDFPMGIGAKIDRWSRLEVDGVFDHWGTWNNDISSNSIACREFFLNPSADPVSVVRKLAVRQFGPEAGAEVFAAWRALERGHAVLSNRAVWAPRQWPNWYGGFYAPLPSEFIANPLQSDIQPTHAACHVAGPSSSTGVSLFEYNDPDSSIVGVGKSWRLAVPHYRKALDHLQKARVCADDVPVFYSFWWSGTQPVPSRKEHIRRQMLYVQSMMLFGREIGIHFELNALSIRVDHDEMAYLPLAWELLEEDAAACRDVLAFIERCVADGDYHADQDRFLVKYRKKLRSIERILDRRSSGTETG